jgi:hypothetical protein
MSRDFLESVKIVIKTDDGNKAIAESKGSAPRGMLLAFTLLPQNRREWVLRNMQAEHEKMVAKEAERAKATTGEQP